MLDDILDLTGDESVTGKRRGADLRDGTVTLPLVLAIAARPDIGPRLVTCRDNETCLEGVLDDVLATGSIERARAMALEFVNEARSGLAACAERLRARAARRARRLAGRSIQLESRNR